MREMIVIRNKKLNFVTNCRRLIYALNAHLRAEVSAAPPAWRNCSTCSWLPHTSRSRRVLVARSFVSATERQFGGTKYQHLHVSRISAHYSPVRFAITAAGKEVFLRREPDKREVGSDISVAVCRRPLHGLVPHRDRGQCALPPNTEFVVQHEMLSVHVT
jgi:hypothetical protein